MRNALPRSSFWLCLCLFGCADSADRAAKRRIFSAEDPPQAVASAAEKLAADRLADEPSSARRVLSMSAAETTERLGPHKSHATLSFDWSARGRSLKLTESRSLTAGRGGVAGDFHGLIDNSREQGLEVIRVGGKVYARSRYGKFRQRLRDRGMAEREREEIFGALRDVDALFMGRLSLTPKGSASHEGRAAFRYDVQLATEGRLGESEPKPPPMLTGGVDETTERRRAVRERRVPQALLGELLVDAQQAVVLKVRLDGRIAVSSSEGNATLHLMLEQSLSAIGKEPPLVAPKNSLPDEDKPEGIAAVLDRFGIPRGKQRADAKDDSGPAEDEPQEAGAP